MSLEQVAAARLRLEWLLDEYGADDVDYVTFKVVVDELEERCL